MDAAERDSVFVHKLDDRDRASTVSLLAPRVTNDADQEIALSSSETGRDICRRNIVNADVPTVIANPTRLFAGGEAVGIMAVAMRGRAVSWAVFSAHAAFPVERGATEACLASWKRVHPDPSSL